MASKKIARRGIVLQCNLTFPSIFSVVGLRLGSWWPDFRTNVIPNQSNKVFLQDLVATQWFKFLTRPVNQHFHWLLCDKRVWVPYLSSSFLISLMLSNSLHLLFSLVGHHTWLYSNDLVASASTPGHGKYFLIDQILLLNVQPEIGSSKLQASKFKSRTLAWKIFPTMLLKSLQITIL